jgi:hypothetical protein
VFVKTLRGSPRRGGSVPVIANPESIDLEVAAAEWRLGRLAASEVQPLALRLLEQGLTGPNLLELAGTPAFALGRDLARAVERAFAEAGFALPTREEAGLLLSREVARAIVEGRVDPYEGAQRIWTLAHDIGEQNFVRVASLVGYASEIEDHPDSRAFYEPRIKEEAARFLEEIAPKR